MLNKPKVSKSQLKYNVDTVCLKCKLSQHYSHRVNVFYSNVEFTFHLPVGRMCSFHKCNVTYCTAVFESGHLRLLSLRFSCFTDRSCCKLLFNSDSLTLKPEPAN